MNKKTTTRNERLTITLSKEELRQIKEYAYINDERMTNFSRAFILDGIQKKGRKKLGTK